MLRAVVVAVLLCAGCVEDPDDGPADGSTPDGDGGRPEVWDVSPDHFDGYVCDPAACDRDCLLHEMAYGECQSDGRCVCRCPFGDCSADASGGRGASDDAAGP